MTLIISQLVLIRGGGRGGWRRLVEKWRLVAGSRNVHAICNRKKARLTFIKDVPGTLQAPEETWAWSRQSLVDYTEASSSTAIPTRGFLSHMWRVYCKTDISHNCPIWLYVGGCVVLPSTPKKTWLIIVTSQCHYRIHCLFSLHGLHYCTIIMG